MGYLWFEYKEAIMITVTYIPLITSFFLGNEGVDKEAVSQAPSFSLPQHIVHLGCAFVINVVSSVSASEF